MGVPPLERLFLSLTQTIALFVLLAFGAGRTGILARFFARPLPWKDRAALAVLTGLLGIVGTYWGVPVQGAIANTRVFGPMIAGLVGGPLTGLGAGLIAGLHRYSLGGFTALACGISTASEGLLAGLVHRFLSRRGRQVTWQAAVLATVMAEALQMAIILAVARPWAEALRLVEEIALPMILMNAVGVGLVVGIIRDTRQQQDRIGAQQAQTALEIASRTLPHLREGLSERSARATCEIILERSDLGAVSITDREQILAFVGIGADHHVTGGRPLIQATWDVLADGQERVAESHSEVGCPVPGCPLTAGVTVPLRDGEQVVGTLHLYQKGKSQVQQVTLELGRGLGQLLSHQIELSRAHAMQQLVTQAELRALHAQINPHFLFNALSTIAAMCRRDPDQARDLLLMLSQYLRSSIRTWNDLVTLGEELAIVEAYLAIEKARFGERLRVELQIESDLMDLKVPILSVQPLVENSVRHGIMPRLRGGTITVTGRREGDWLLLTVSDDGVGMDLGARQSEQGNGVGMANVRNRLRHLYGAGDLMEVASSPETGTTVRLRLPLQAKPSPESEGQERELLRLGGR